MSQLLADERLVWFLMRGTGVVLALLLTLTTVLGVLSAASLPARWWPQFTTQSLHRTVSALAVVLMGAHTAAAVLHEYVDIRWWDAVVPFAGPYEPLWVGLGAVALDLVLLITLTSLVRRRLGHRTWRAIHLSAYVAWALGIVHGLGLGTDATSSWSAALTAACLALVVAALALRGATWYEQRRLHGAGNHPSPARELAPRTPSATIWGGRR